MFFLESFSDYGHCSFHKHAEIFSVKNPKTTLRFSFKEETNSLKQLVLDTWNAVLTTASKSTAMSLKRFSLTIREP